MRRISLVMMVKNEEKRILVSLRSVIGTISSFVILDTGSTDNTISIIESFCKKNGVVLHMIKQTFPEPFDYSLARNTVLEYADRVGEDFLLLMDCNDELVNGDVLKRQIENLDYKKFPTTAFHVCQEWWNGTGRDKYYNVRLLRRGFGWRYKDPIHEYIWNEKSDSDRSGVYQVGKMEGFSLYQDRTLDDDKSAKRFHRDEYIFDRLYKKNREDIEEGKAVSQNSRHVFYYAQTCACLQKFEKAYKLYIERIDLGGYTEEIFHSYMRAGDMASAMNHSWEEVMQWYLLAYQYSSENFRNPRAEPLYKIASHYRDNKSWALAYMYIKRCCELQYPYDLTLFIDRAVYDYSRWHLMGIIGFYAKKYNDGIFGCVRAYLHSEKDIDRDNLKFYLDDQKYSESMRILNGAKKGSIQKREFEDYINSLCEKPFGESIEFLAVTGWSQDPQFVPSGNARLDKARQRLRNKIKKGVQIDKDL